MKEQQVRKNCQSFMNKLQNTNAYESVKGLLLCWKKQDKQHNVPAAVDAFMRITKAVYELSQGEKDDKLIECFNRCLEKDAIVPKKIVTSDSVEEAAEENPQSSQIIEKVKEWMKEPRPIEKPTPPPPVAIEEIKDQALLPRLEAHPHFRDITKILQLYLKSVISFEELRTLLHPVFSSDPSLAFYLIQTAEEVIQRRRRATIFAPLNQLVDKKYPNLYQVGQSYILIPEGYANYSRGWRSNPLEYIMNRKCVSVPLGSEVSFIINKKTDYEEQLFNYEDQRYEIDNALSSLRAAITLLELASKEPSRLESPLLHRVINQLYPNQNVGTIFIRNPEIARSILLPRVTQKCEQLIQCREKFIKICEQVAVRNFYKSLDYRCFYFAKNDKKFNCPLRWEKQIQLRKQQIKQNKDIVAQEQIEDRQSLQRGRYFYVNSFDNITKENFIQNKEICSKFDHRLNAVYPSYPENQILFILNFTEEGILNDVLEVILYYCSRKNVLELLIFKLMRTDIKKRLKKSPLLNHLIQTKEKIANNPDVTDVLNNLGNAAYLKNLEQQGNPVYEEMLLNDGKGLTKTFKDSEEEFMQMIEEDEEPVLIEEEESPFEGPTSGYTFIATKQVYIFMRYVTAIYQRFLKAKQYAEQLKAGGADRSEEQRLGIDIYKFFITVLVYKIKDRKYFEEYLRKLFCKKAFIFFTLQKMIMSAAKTINNIGTDSLSFQIIKDQTKDYELGAFDWEKYTFPTVMMQLTRLYLEQETLFRFTYEPNERNFYISAWNPPFKEPFVPREKSQELNHRMERFTTEPTKLSKVRVKGRKTEKAAELYNAEEITRIQGGKLILKGELIVLNKERDEKRNWLKLVKQDLHKIKMSKKLIT